MKLSERITHDYLMTDEKLEEYGAEVKELEDRITNLSAKLDQAIDLLSVEQRAMLLVGWGKMI